MLSILFLLAAAPAVPTPTIRVLCVTMADDAVKMTTQACVSGATVRIEAKTAKAALPVWLIDFAKQTNVFLGADGKVAQKQSFDAVLGQLRAAKVLAERTKTMRAEIAALAKAKVEKAEADAGAEGCVWYSVAAGSDTCQVCAQHIDDAELVRAVLLLATTVRTTQIKRAPLQFNGLPLVNVHLPIFLADGVLLPNHLPTRVKVGTRELAFGYAWEERAAVDFATK